MKVMTILGTRPELIKLSEIIKKLDANTDHTFVHTGQNYDYELDEIFYDDLGLRKPDYNFRKSDVPYILMNAQRVMEDDKPDAVVILGDTNSALSAYAAKQLKIPLFHLEAGNRCFDDNTPEEINRRIVDHISDINLVYTEHARRNLLAEGLKADRIYLMGSPMGEVILNNLDKIKDGIEKPKEKYYLVSIHRAENVDNKENLDAIVKSINKLSMSHNVILSCHPRLANKKAKFSKKVKVCKPFGFIEYLRLQINAECVISDSGTVAEESAILGFPAITVRNAMERPEAVDNGSIVKASPNTILDCVPLANRSKRLPSGYDIENCSDRVLKIIMGYTDYVRRYVYHE